MEVIKANDKAKKSNTKKRLEPTPNKKDPLPIPTPKKIKFIPKQVEVLIDADAGDDYEASIRSEDFMDGVEEAAFALSVAKNSGIEVDPFATQQDKVKLPQAIADKFNPACHENLYSSNYGKPYGAEWYFSASLKCFYRVPCFRCGEFLTGARINELVKRRSEVAELESRGVKLRMFSMCELCERRIRSYIDQDPQFYNGGANTAIYTFKAVVPERVPTNFIPGQGSPLSSKRD